MNKGQRLVLWSVLSVALLSGWANAAVITIGAGDVAWNPSGFDVEVRYELGADAYYLNSNTSTPWISGINNGLAYSNHAQVGSEGTIKYVCASDWGSTPATLVWTFDVSGTGQTVAQASVMNSTFAWSDGAYLTNVTWYASTDWNGSTGTWTPYCSVYSNGYGGTFATDGGRFWDLPSTVQGASSFSIKAVLQPYWGYMTPEIFRTNAGSAYGLDMQIALSSVGTVNGKVALPNFQGDMTTVGAQFVLTPVGGGDSITKTILLPSDGSFQFDNVSWGTYNLTVRTHNSVRAVKNNVEVSATPNDVGTITLNTADINGDNQVSFEDFAILQNGYGQTGAAGANPLSAVAATGGCGALGAVLMSLMVMGMLGLRSRD